VDRGTVEDEGRRDEQARDLTKANGKSRRRRGGGGKRKDRHIDMISHSTP
jgi:hypothetical protein